MTVLARIRNRTTSSGSSILQHISSLLAISRSPPLKTEPILVSVFNEHMSFLPLGTLQYSPTHTQRYGASATGIHIL